MKRFVLLLLITITLTQTSPTVTYFMTTNANWDGDLNTVIDMINLNQDLNKVTLQDTFCQKSLNYKQENKFRQNVNIMFLYFYLPGGIKSGTIKIRDNKCTTL